MESSSHHSPFTALSPRRMRPYEEEARLHPEVTASELYRWDMTFSGVAMTQLSYVEMSVRNVVDIHMRRWVKAEVDGMDDWIGIAPDRQWFEGYGVSQRKQKPLELSLPKLVKTLVGANRIEGLWNICRNRVYKEWVGNDRHPRHGSIPDRDDAFAQMTIGDWARLFGPTENRPDDPRWKAAHKLWSNCLAGAFPNLPKKTGMQDNRHEGMAVRVGRLRRLRNRIAHGENILQAEPMKYLDTMYSLLDAMDSRAITWLESQTGDTYRMVAGFKYHPDLLKQWQHCEIDEKSGNLVATRNQVIR